MPTPTPYTFTPTSDGNIQVAQGGKIISTGTADNAALNYGYVAPGAAPKAPAVQQTTTAVRTTAAANGAKLDGKIAAITPQQPVVDPNANAGDTKVPAIAPGLNALPTANAAGAKVTGDIDNGDGTHTVSYADGTSDRVKVTGNQDGSNSYAVLTPEAGVKYDADQQTAAAKTKAAAQVTQANTTLDGIKAQSDAATQALIASIQTTYQARMQLMEDSNNRVMGAKTQEGIRSGRARYAAGLQEGILTDEEQQGLGRITQLQGEMMSLIQQAQKAQTDEDLTLFNDRMTALDKIDSNLQTEVQNIQKNAFDSLKQMQDDAKAKADAAKAQQQQALDSSKRVAPAVAAELAKLPDAASQAAFLEEYSKQSGIPVDVLMGDIQTYNDTQTKDKLNADNIRSEIASRAKNDAKTAADDTATTTVNNIINGVSSLADADPKDVQKVKAALQKYGLYSETPPDWFIKMTNDQAGASLQPDAIQQKWDDYRTTAGVK